MTRAATDLGDSPRGVFADELLGVLESRGERGQILVGADVAEGHADVAEETAALGPEDG